MPSLVTVPRVQESVFLVFDNGETRISAEFACTRWQAPTPSERCGALCVIVRLATPLHCQPEARHHDPSHGRWAGTSVATWRSPRSHTGVPVGVVARPTGGGGAVSADSSGTADRPPPVSVVAGSLGTPQHSTGKPGHHTKRRPARRVGAARSPGGAARRRPAGSTLAPSPRAAAVGSAPGRTSWSRARRQLRPHCPHTRARESTPRACRPLRPRLSAGACGRSRL